MVLALSNILSLEPALIALANGGGQMEKYQLHQSGIPLNPVPTRMMHHHQGLGPAPIASIPYCRVDADSAAEKAGPGTS